MSSAPSEGGGARSKEVNNNPSSHIFAQAFFAPIHYIFTIFPAACKAKRKARDGNIEEGAKEGGNKEGRAKERRDKKERFVA